MPYVPDEVPVLTQGKHRHPGKGACFMEFASYLAGERWSDHPSCTHPLLASVARLVNDVTSDAGRQRLVPLIPSVIGLNGDDPRLDVVITLRAAMTALPVVAAERQRVMAASILAGSHVLAEFDPRLAERMQADSANALEQVPDAREWAQRFGRHLKVSMRGFRRQAAPHTVAAAVDGIGRACIHNPDELLYALLSQTITDVRSLVSSTSQHEQLMDGSRRIALPA